MRWVALSLLVCLAACPGHVAQEAPSTADTPGAGPGVMTPLDVPSSDTRGPEIDGGSGEETFSLPDVDAAADVPEVDAAVDVPDVAMDLAADAPDVATVVPSVSLLSLNLHCLETSGTPYATNEARAAAIASAVVEHDGEVVAVQEACVSSDTSMHALLLEALGDGWTAVWEPAHTAWEGTPAEAEEGIALFALGTLDDPVAVHHAVPGSLARVSVCATWGELRVCSVHLDHQDAAARLSQSREVAVAALVDAAPSLNVVIAGDLNAREGEPAHQALLDAGYVDLSDTLSSERIDHVLVHRGTAWRADHAELVFEESPVSDHPGVLIRLAPHEPEAVTVTPVDATPAPGQVELGHFLSLRGSRAPLDWDAGWPMRSVGPNTWRAIVTEWEAGTVELKVLRDEIDWMLGPNVEGTAGEPIAITPEF